VVWPAQRRTHCYAARRRAVEQYGQIRRAVDRVRELALDRLRLEMHIAFGLDPDGPPADRLALAAFVGAVVADRARPAAAVREVLEHLPAALVTARRELAPPGGAL
jgi:hypothetical protein